MFEYSCSSLMNNLSVWLGFIFIGQQEQKKEPNIFFPSLSLFHSERQPVIDRLYREIRHWYLYDSYWMIVKCRMSSLMTKRNHFFSVHVIGTYNWCLERNLFADDDIWTWVQDSIAMSPIQTHQSVESLLIFQHGNLKSESTKLSKNPYRKVDRNLVKTLNERSQIIAWIIHNSLKLEIFLYFSSPTTVVRLVMLLIQTCTF